MALIPVGAVDYKTALVAARVAFTSSSACAISGDRRGFASVAVASGTVTVTLAAAQIVGLADIVVVGHGLIATADTVAGTKRCQPLTVNATTGVVTLKIIKDDVTSGVPAYDNSANGDVLHLALMLVYNQE